MEGSHRYTETHSLRSAYRAKTFIQLVMSPDHERRIWGVQFNATNVVVQCSMPVTIRPVFTSYTFVQNPHLIVFNQLKSFINRNKE